MSRYSRLRALSTARYPWVVRVLLMLAVLWMPGLSLAQESTTAGAGEADTSRPWTLGIALGQGRRSNPFVASDDLDLNAVVDAAWYGERFFFDNGDLGYTFNETSRFSASALLTFDNERNYFSYLNNGSSGLDIFSLRAIAEEKGFTGGVGVASGEDLDSLTTTELEDLIYQNIDSSLPDRDFAANGGVEVVYISPWGDLQAQFLTDVSSTHDGESAFVSYSYPWLLQRSEISFTIGAEWKSRELVDYYYGVRKEDSLDGRPIYRGSAGTNAVVRMSASHSLSEHWKLVGMVEREYLSSAIRRSPIINESRISSFFLGLHYQF
ncbi:MAG: MipA/OmpV family protein [Gammaproteobacteria bacterium]|nr:MipA/OmpV family protein [Gammaproteobacteria bacterium]MDP2141248.1 MipA/OmpV family protein [Gammaproteobacteria bacterium]MDP2349078.1 MipA/OmpV family protein [Gammaproteobacteria bacterium]